MAEDLPRRGVRRAALRDLLRLLALIGKPRWATPTLIILGLVSSFAETVGITLILLFLYSATGHVGDSGGGMIGQVVAKAAAWFGNTTELSCLILALIIARGALALLYGRISSNIADAISERARNMVHRQYLDVAFGFIQSRQQSNLMEILATETWVISAAYASLTRLIINACSVGVFALFLALISWKIMAVAALGAAFISGTTRLFTRRARALGIRVKETHEFLGLQMLMTIQGMRTIRAYGQESAHQERFRKTSAEARAVSQAMERLSAWIGPVTEVGYLAVLCVIVAGAGWWHTSFAITLGAVALLYRLQPHTNEFENHLMHFAQIQPQLRSVRLMLERGDKTYPPAGHIPFQTLRGPIAFRNVTLRYQPGAEPALDGISFTIPAGATTAIIGASGAGKTTIVNLLLRLYEPTGGLITVDGVPLTDLRREDWVSRIGVAGQDVELVDGTVIDNIRMSDPFCDESKILAAAASAGVAAFVDDLPDGYNTWIGPEGLRFSGGQRQRIGLARAMLRDSQLLILDEAMSALDRALEDRIKGEINRQPSARTILIITHRLETIRDADHVIWIENGRLRAEGRPAAILPQAEPALTTPA